MKYRLISRAVLVVAVMAMTVAGFALPSADAEDFASEADYIASLGRICEEAWKDASASGELTVLPPVSGIEYWEAGYPDHAVTATALVGTPGDDLLIGSTASDVILGDRGNDLICGGSGNDELFGGPGDDHIFGNGGDDRILGQRDEDILLGNEGVDELSGGEGEDRLCGGTETDTYFGHSAIVIDSASNEGWDPDPGSVVEVDVVPFNHGLRCPLIFQVGSLVLEGVPDLNVSADDLGADKLGFAELDYVRSLGEECFEIWVSGVEVLVGRPQNGLDYWEDGYPGISDASDTMSFTHSIGLEVDDGSTGGAYLEGSTIFNKNRDARVYFIGSHGPDTFSGGNNDDILCGGPGTDVLNGKGGDDRIFGGPDFDQLLGKDGDDRLDGGDDYDKLWGGDGADILCGGADDVPGELYGGGTSKGKDDHYEVNGGTSKRGVEHEFDCPFNRPPS